MQRTFLKIQCRCFHFLIFLYCKYVDDEHVFKHVGGHADLV